MISISGCAFSVPTILLGRCQCMGRQRARGVHPQMTDARGPAEGAAGSCVSACQQHDCLLCAIVCGDWSVSCDADKSDSCMGVGQRAGVYHISGDSGQCPVRDMTATRTRYTRAPRVLSPPHHAATCVMSVVALCVYCIFV